MDEIKAIPGSNLPVFHLYLKTRDLAECWWANNCLVELLLNPLSIIEVQSQVVLYPQSFVAHVST